MQIMSSLYRLSSVKSFASFFFKREFLFFITSFSNMPKFRVRFPIFSVFFFFFSYFSSSYSHRPCNEKFYKITCYTHNKLHYLQSKVFMLLPFKVIPYPRTRGGGLTINYITLLTRFKIKNLDFSKRFASRKQ